MAISMIVSSPKSFMRGLNAFWRACLLFLVEKIIADEFDAPSVPENGHEAVVKLLLSTGKVDVDSTGSKSSRTPLSRAAENWQEAVVKLPTPTHYEEVDGR
jgi:hypothetical protein